MCYRGQVEPKPLPLFLRWFDCADWYFPERDTTVIKEKIREGKMVYWSYITLRNPTNYFAYRYLGLTVERPVECKYERVELDRRVMFKDVLSYRNKIGDKDLPGLFHGEYRVAGKDYFEYYYIYPYRLFNKQFCFRFRMGWKIGPFEDIEGGQHVQWVFVISPLHSYTGVKV